MSSIFSSIDAAHELERLQSILDSTCEQLNIPKTPATHQVRDFLGRELLALRDAEDAEDEILRGRLASRARIIGINAHQKHSDCSMREKRNAGLPGRC
jgi:hypothetical protein